MWEMTRRAGVLMDKRIVIRKPSARLPGSLGETRYNESPLSS